MPLVRAEQVGYRLNTLDSIQDFAAALMFLRHKTSFSIAK
jgi:hypothetical protein